MTTLVQKNLMLRIMEMISREDAELLEALIDEKGADAPEVRAFLVEHIPNLDELLEEEVSKVKQDLVKATPAGREE